MAWLFTRKTSGIQYTDFEVENRTKGDFEANDREFRKGLSLDCPVPTFEAAHQIRQTDSRVPDVLTLQVYHFCNRRFKDFVERFEPDMHYFLPFDLKRKNGEKIDDYYVWALGQDIDCILTDNLSAFWDERHGGLIFSSVINIVRNDYEDSKREPRIRLRISKPAVEGRHFWTGGLLTARGIGYTTYFMSDEMYRAYKREKLTGLQLIGPVEEVDIPWRAEDNMNALLERWRLREENIRKYWPDAQKRHGGQN